MCKEIYDKGVQSAKTTLNIQIYIFCLEMSRNSIKIKQNFFSRNVFFILFC